MVNARSSNEFKYWEPEVYTTAMWVAIVGGFIFFLFFLHFRSQDGIYWVKAVCLAHPCGRLGNQAAVFSNIYATHMLFFTVKFAGLDGFLAWNWRRLSLKERRTASFVRSRDGSSVWDILMAVLALAMFITLALSLISSTMQDGESHIIFAF